jgi:hypothetical protein
VSLYEKNIVYDETTEKYIFYVIVPKTGNIFEVTVGLRKLGPCHTGTSTLTIKRYSKKAGNLT